MLYRGCCYPCIVVLPQRLVGGDASSALDVEYIPHAYRRVKAVRFTVPRGEVGSFIYLWFEQILFLHLHTMYVRPTWLSPVCRMPAVIEVFQFSVPCRLRCRQSSAQGFLDPFSTSPTACLLCAGDTDVSLRSPCIAGFQALPRGGAESDFSALDSYISVTGLKAGPPVKGESQFTIIYSTSDNSVLS
jgi:hypothetical protein